MSEEKKFLQPAIPRFDGHYDHWSMLMENLLRSKGYWSLVETGYEEPHAGAALNETQQKQLEEFRTKDLKVKNYLFQAIDRTILEQNLEKRTSKQIWDSMKRKFEGNARVKRSIFFWYRNRNPLSSSVKFPYFPIFTRVLLLTTSNPTITCGPAIGLGILLPKRRKGVKGAQPGPILSRAHRVKIAVGAARGLEYLHEKAQPHIIHSDIKSSNVLLFDDDVAKIADFDLSNQAPDMAARLHSTRVLGTFGYHAPEYAMTGQLNSKSDVYSFGVVLLELLTGRKPVDHTLPRGQQSLVTWDVSHKLDEQKDEYLTQLKENEMLRNKLNHLSDQYAVSEQQFTQKLKQKTLELQLADLKLQQHEEKLTQEQSQMKLYAEQVSQLLATEKNLRLQLAADGEKFQQFQDALLKSNEVFETFKQEIEKMAKSIKELKKENIFLKGKCERSDVTLIELVDEREQWKKQLEKMKNQKEKLESLCRSLQAERKQNSAGTNSSDQTLVGSKTSSSETVSGDTSRTSLQSEEL